MDLYDIYPIPTEKDEELELTTLNSDFDFELKFEL
jgi:hypothetical protein